MNPIKTAGKIKTYKMSKLDWQTIGKQAGWFSKEDTPVRTKEDSLIDHFKNRISPKVKAELKRVANLDYHYIYLIKSIEKGLTDMLGAYDKVNMRDKNMNERAKVEKILLEDPSSSLASLNKGLAPFLEKVNKTKDSADLMEHRVALKNYHDGLQRLYNLLHEYAENYFRELGRVDAIPKIGRQAAFYDDNNENWMRSIDHKIMPPGEGDRVTKWSEKCECGSTETQEIEPGMHHCSTCNKDFSVNNEL